MLRRRGQSVSQPGDEFRSHSTLSLPKTQVYPHTTTYRSLNATLRVYSRSVKAQGGPGKQQLEAVFGDGDIVSGLVTLDAACSASGRLTVKLEGALLCHPPDGPAQSTSKVRKHIFFTISHSIHSSAIPTAGPSAFARGMVRTIRRRPSASSLDDLSQTTSMTPEKERTCPFSFNLPRGVRSGQELPPTYSSFRHGQPPSPLRAGSFSVEYKITMSWEPIGASERSLFIEAPILYQPDHDFSSIGENEPRAWLEMPLRTDRPIPFRCAITLPSNVTFSRSSSIPYFVVFTTTPRSPSLVKEIASDATISVSLLRQVTVTESAVLPPTPPQTPSTPEDDSGPRRFMRRITKSRSSRALDDKVDVVTSEKPLPHLPAHTIFSETYTMRTSICIGFPKRPRGASDGRKHPTIKEHIALPDGLHKAKFLLDKDMLPSIDWAGVSVKYYLEASVLIGQDEVRVRIPIRIL